MNEYYKEPLTEQQIKLLRQYCLYPVMASASLATALLIGGVWLVLVMVNDMVFYAPFNPIGLWLYLGIVFVYMVIFVVLFLSSRKKGQSDDCYELMRMADTCLAEGDYSAQISTMLGARAAGHLLKMSSNKGLKSAGEVAEATAAIGTLITVAQMTGRRAKQGRVVAGVLGVPVPRARRYVLPLVLIPVVLLAAVYIPHFMAAKQSTDAQRQTAAQSVYAVQQAFLQGCEEVYIDDPLEQYSRYGYSVTGYLYSYESENKAYITVEVGNDGVLHRVSYYISVDITQEKQENLTRAQQDFATLNALLNSAGVSAVSPEILRRCDFSSVFAAQFNSGSYYEEIFFRENDYISVSYTTDTEEEYDEYSTSYIYLSIDE